MGWYPNITAHQGLNREVRTAFDYIYELESKLAQMEAEEKRRLAPPTEFEIAEIANPLPPDTPTAFTSATFVVAPSTSMVPLVTDTGQIATPISGNNKLNACQFVLPFDMTIRSAAMLRGANGPTAYDFSAGLYNENQGKIVSGPVRHVNSSAVAAVETMNIPETKLVAGVYYSAYTSTLAGQAQFLTMVANVLDYPGFIREHMNLGTKKVVGEPTATTSGAVLPASFGTLNNTGGPPPYVIYSSVAL